MRPFPLILSSLLLCPCGVVWSQAYDPYAPSMDERLPVVSADGKLNWPSFFKSVGTEAKFQSLFAQGICTGTRKVTTAMLQDNKVNVNALPETSFVGLAVKIQPGIVTVVDVQGQTSALLIHPANVTRVSVSGTIPPAGIAPGMIVRLQGKVDATGKGTEPIEALEIVDGNPDVTAIAVAPDKLQTIVGVITRAKRNIFQMKMASGKVRRLTFVLAEKPTITVNAKSLSAILPGAEVKVKGHVYEGEGKIADKMIFASDIDVTEKFVWDKAEKPADNKIAGDKAVAAGQQP